jgi:hypothetical protein
MIAWIYLAAIGLALPHLGLSSTLTPSDPNPDRFQTIERECFQKDWSQEVCGLTTRPEYIPGPVSLASEPLFDLLYTFASSISTSGLELSPTWQANTSGDNTTCALGVCAGKYHTQGEAIIAVMTRRILETADKKPLRECQKTCLATCVASRLLTYEKSPTLQAASESFAAYTGRGACTEYSRLADRFIGTIGIKSWTVSNLNIAHQYIGVEVEGQYLYFDPQHRGCTFISAE